MAALPIIHGPSEFPDLSTLSPETRQALLSLSTEGQRGAMLEHQLAQAEALRGHSLAAQRSSPIGSAFSGLADVLNAGRATNSEADALRRQQGLVQGHEAGLSARMEAGNAPMPEGALGDAQSTQAVLQALLRGRRPAAAMTPPPEPPSTDGEW